MEFAAERLREREEEPLFELCITEYSGTFDPNEPEFQFFVRDGQKHITATMKPSESVCYLKRWISERTGYSLRHLFLIYSGQVLDNDKTLSYYNIEKEVTVHVRMRHLSCHCCL